MSEQERDEALALLRDPKLLDRILADFDACGVVGEDTNKLVGYLAAVSRKFDKPLGVIIQSTSAAGKSSPRSAGASSRITCCSTSPIRLRRHCGRTS